MFDSPTFAEGQVVGSGDVRAVTYGEDKGLYVEFFKEPVHLEYKSEQEGRPIYEDRTFVRIYVPGDKTKVIVRQVFQQDHDGIPADPKRWPSQWAAFQAGEDATPDGTPLKEWPQITKSQLEELKYFRVHTIEQLAAVTDGVLDNMGHGARLLRDQAAAWLARSSDDSAAHKMEQRHNEEMRQMQQQLAELRASIQTKEDDKRGPGRPRKEPEE